MNRILPYPLLSFSIVIMWLLLSSFTVGQLLLGSLVGIGVGPVMARLQPQKVKIKSWKAIGVLIFRVLVDITLSNVEVVKIIFSGGPKKGQSGFMVLPLDLKERISLAILACVLTATPGTAWVAFDEKRSELLLHVLDLHDEAYWRNLIKSRYETLLLEMFE